MEEEFVGRARADAASPWVLKHHMAMIGRRVMLLALVRGESGGFSGYLTIFSIFSQFEEKGKFEMKKNWLGLRGVHREEEQVNDFTGFFG